MTGILISLVGVLGGLALALYYRSEMFKAHGDKRVLAVKLDVEVKAHDVTLTQAQKNAKLYVDDTERKEELIAYYAQRSSDAQARRLANSSPKELRKDANDLFPSPSVSDRLQPLHSDADDRGNEVAYEDGDGFGIVSDETPTK